MLVYRVKADGSELQKVSTRDTNAVVARRESLLSDLLATSHLRGSFAARPGSAAFPPRGAFDRRKMRPRCRERVRFQLK